MELDLNDILNQQDEKKAEVTEESVLDAKFSPEKMELSRKTLVDMRRRIAGGDTIPKEELAEALSLIRQMYGREAIATAAKRAKAKPKKAAKKKPVKVDVDSLLGDILGGL